MGVEKKVVSIRLDEDFIEKLKQCAKEENRTMSNLIETVLLDYVQNKKDNKKEEYLKQSYPRL